MPLPANGATWPPPALAAITPKLVEWSAWYSGDPDTLRAAYTGSSLTPKVRPAQLQGGIVGAVARTFWGRPHHDLTVPRSQLHVPIAADICQASADLLYAEPPTLTAPDDAVEATRVRLEGYADDGLHNQLAEAAEIAAALGSAYLRVTWDREVQPDGPFLTSVHADAALPEFRYGRLVAVTFWRVLVVNGQQYVRHLERHELNSQGDGIILHGLYEGSQTDLGRIVPLTEHAGTARLATMVNADGAILTESPGLAVEHVPNQRPQRRWRNDPLGANLGRSDLDGIEPLMDALDEAWSSWMRDLRLGKARIVAARSALQDQGAGMGATFDTDREVYEALNVLGSRDASGLPITPVQFAIRVDEHARTCQELTENILRSAGYSAQTFGEESGVAVTATEVQSRERRSFMTRDRKVRHQRPAVGRIVEKMLAVDRAVFAAAGVVPVRPLVSFGDSVQDSPEALARTAELLRRAESASIETRIGIVHPEWSAEQVRDEATAIRGELSLPDPLSITPDQP